MDILSLGFTGTQHGVTDKQKFSIGQLIKILQPSEAHHGDCVGADADFHNLLLLHANDCTIHVHPANIPGKRAFVSLGHIIRHPVKDPLVRNLDIILESMLLIACPRTHAEEIRSGTWSTIRRARDKKLLRFIVWPDGTFSEEGSGAVKFLLALQNKKFTKSSNLKAYSAGDVLVRQDKTLDVLDIGATMPSGSSIVYVFDKTTDTAFPEDEEVLAKTYAIREGPRHERIS